MKHRSKVLVVVLIGVVCLATLGAVAVIRPGIRYRARRLLQEVGLVAPSLPLYITPHAPPDRVTARRLVVDSLHDALARNDYEQAAMLNAILSMEAFQRAYRTLKAWETTRDPDTGLLPKAVSPWYQGWNIHAVGANLYSHLLIASHYLDPDNTELWDHIITYERQVCGAMPCDIDFESGAVVGADQDALIQGASEYTRDGLLTISERFGPGLWFDRMVEGVNVIIDAAYIETQFGLISANSTEVNGSQLQVLSRLYWATGDIRYLQTAERIAETYLFEVFPNNQGLPTDYWDFETQSPLPEDVRFRPAAESIPDIYPFRLVDHGGEIISGLTELYYVERMLNRPQADRYRQPLQEFLDKIIETGRTDEGLWYRSIDASTLEPFNDQPNDTWGYNLVGFLTFDLVEGTDRYTDEIELMMRAVANTHSIDWEWGPQQDGYADTIESMLYLLPWFDIPECHYWVDDEIEVMFLKQRFDGFVEGWYLDGNFVRTALMYGQYKSQGLMLAPWQENVRVGAAFDRENDTLYVHVAAQEDWQGKLRFDTPRHQIIWNLPIEYPRVNGLPEWYVVEPASSYLVTNLDTGEVDTYLGQQLVEGIPVILNGSQGSMLRLTVSQQTTAQTDGQ